MKTTLTYAYKIIPLLLLLPTLVFACNANEKVWDISILQGPLITCVGANPSGAAGSSVSSGATSTQCQNLCDLVCTVANVIYFMIGVVLWIVTPITFAIGGIMYMIARGQPDNLNRAKKILTGAIIGVFIVIIAYLLVYTFVNIIGIQNIGGFSGGSSAACSINQ